MNSYISNIERSLNTFIGLSKMHEQLPLIHIALKTKSYLCYNTATRFKEELNTKDALGHTALDCAIEHYQHFSNKLIKEPGEKNRLYNHNMRTYYANVLCDLHLHKAHHTQPSLQRYQSILELAQQHNSSNQLPIVCTLEEYKKTIEQLRSMPMRSLKQDKVDALKLLEKASLSERDLQQLKCELYASPTASPLKFIKELRSELWIIRYLRGAYGYSSTLAQMNQLLQIKIQEIEQEAKNSPSI